jgi:hypothetical protein
LIDSAVTGAEPTPEFRSHVAACTSCAADLAEQRSLIAAIDANLQRQMNAPIPAATLQRFEARLAQQTTQPPARPLRLRWLYAPAAMAAAASIILLVSHTRSIKPNPRIARQAPAIQRITPAADAPRASIRHSPQELSVARTKMRTTNVSARKEPEVLVPPDDRIAFEHFVADLDGREVLAATLAKRVPLQELSVAPLEVPEIQTASLRMSPVQESAAIGDR